MFNYLSAPIKVSFDITYQCNLKCLHCRISEEQKKDELFLSEVQKIIDELSAMKVFVLGISGGEPLTRSGLTDIIVYAAKSDIVRILLSTNCTLLSDDVLTELRDYRDKLVLKVSIDGLSDTHDSIRGIPGAFEKTVESVRFAINQGFRVNVTTTLMKCNFQEFIEVIEFTHKLGVRKHRIIGIMPLGKANADLILSDKDLKSAWLLFKHNEEKLKRPDFDVALDIPFMEQPYTEFTCKAGISECGILPDGTVVGCRLMPEFTSGSIKDRKFSEIWKNAESFKPFRTLTPDEIIGNCLSCEYGESCRGGCRAYSMAIYKDFYMPDPRCPLA